MNSILNQINSLLYPYVLGFRSENNCGSFVVTNTECTQMRCFGERKWYAFLTTPDDKYNNRLDVVSHTVEFGDDYIAGMLPGFLKDEGIEDHVKALVILDECNPYFLALRGDPQGQYHYCLTVTDPMENVEQKVSYIFPETQFDLYDLLPESETTNPSPMVGGSLGWLAHLSPFDKTLSNIEAAKKRLE